jgi:hypothetical protein
MRYTIDSEAEHRRVLLRLAAKGNAQARKKLEQEYHACVYSAAQLASYSPKIEQSSISVKVQMILDGLCDVRDNAMY